MPHTYILECADGSFYVGSTIDLGLRLFLHNEGVGSAYTRPAKRRPVKLAWSAEFENIGAAFAFEKQVQNWSRAKRIALIEGRFEDLPALARGRNRPSKQEQVVEQTEVVVEQTEVVVEQRCDEGASVVETTHRKAPTQPTPSTGSPGLDDAR